MSSSSQKLESTPVSFYGLALRLRRGASEIVSWSCDRGSLEGTLSVGSDPKCDWTVRGPGIAPFELSVRAPEGRLQVKSARPGMGAKLDGEVLGADWVSLDPGSRLEFGFACIALEFDAAPLTGVVAHEHEVPLAFLGTPLPGSDTSPQANDQQVFAQQAAPAQPQASAKPAAKASKSAPVEVTPQAISGNSAIITQHLVFESFLRSLEAKSEQLREWLGRAGEQGRSQLTQLRKVCSQAFARVHARSTQLLHDLRIRLAQKRARSAARLAKPPSRRTSLVIYSLVFAITAFAYTYWLLLLDRM